MANVARPEDKEQAEATKVHSIKVSGVKRVVGFKIRKAGGSYKV